MSNKINLNNRPEIEMVKLNSEDLSLTPPRFAINGQKMKLANGWNWGFIECPGKPQITHLRQFTARQTTDIGFIQMADSPLSKPHGIHIDDLYPDNSPLEYKEIKGDTEGLTNDAVTYEQRIDETPTTPKLLYRYSSKHVRAVEGNILDVTFDCFPYAMIMNENGPLRAPYIQQHALIKGKFEGKPVTYLGAWDRIYAADVPETVSGSASGDFSTGMMFSGITVVGVRSDGRRESGLMGIAGGRGFAFFFRDGEEPIVTTDVEMDANWVPLPYVNDGTMVFTEATFRFADKVIHYKANWGFRGHNPKLESEKWWPGFSQTGGVWYEGDKPYEFAHSFVFAESRNAFKNQVESSI